MAINGAVKAKKKRSKNNDLTTYKGTQALASASMLKLFNYKAITDDPDHLIAAKDKNDGFMDVLSIQGQGVGTMAWNQQNMIVDDFLRFLRGYLPDIDFIITPFPIDTSSQKSFWGRRYMRIMNLIQQTSDPNRLRQLQTQRKYIQIKQQQNVSVEEQLSSEEFFLVIFGKTKESIRDRRDTAMNLGGSALIMQQLSLNKKEELLFKINNLNTEIK